MRKARAQGYRSRSAYKLIEVNNRERLLIPGSRVADIGAAPGGWSQVAAERVGARGKVVAVDLLEVAPLPGVTVLQGDFRDPATQAQIAQAIAGGRFDLVLSDLSPNLSGIAVTDQARAAELTQSVLDFCRRWLDPDGALLVKVFQGVEFEALLREAKSSFRSVRVIKPAASRGESRETYFLARNLNR